MFWALAWLVLPMVLKSQLESRLSEQLGRQVRIGLVDVKPWSLELAIDDFSVAYADASKPGAQLSIKRLYIDAEAQSLLRLAPVVDAIRIDSPRLHLKHLGGGHFDVDDVLVRLGQAPATPDSPPLGFALYNLVLARGELTLDDVAVDQAHRVTDLTIELPFLSSLSAKREVQVQPRLAFLLNGSRFESAAQSTPFADNRKTEASFSLKGLDLAPYLAYWPASLPVRLTSGVLDADLKLGFEQTAQPFVVLSGVVVTHNVRLISAGAIAKSAPAQDLVAFETLRVQLADVQPLARSVQLGRVDWVNPQVHMSRNAQGVLNWQALFVQPKPVLSASKNIASNAYSTGTTGQNDQKNSPWRVTVAYFGVEGGELRWADAATPVPVQLTAQGLNLSARALAWPITHAVPFEGSADLETAKLSFTGSATDQAADLTVKLKDAPLSLAGPYLAGSLVPRLSGLLNLDMAVAWQAPLAARATMQLAIQVPSLTLDRLELVPAHRQASGGKTPLASVRQIQVDQAALDLTRQTINLGQVRVTQPKTALTRHADGRWMFEDWLKTHDEGRAADASKPVTKPVTKPWQLAINTLNLTQGVFDFADASTPKPVAFGLSGVSLQVKNFASQGNKSLGWRLDARMQHGQTEPSDLAGRGTLAMSPLALQGDLNLQRLPLQALAPYMDGGLNIELLRADASFKGNIALSQRPTGMAVQLRGDTRLENFRADTLAQAEPFKPAEELLSWKDLSLTGLDLMLAPGAVPRVEVAQTVLSDFFAKLTLSETGRLNLQDVQGAGADAKPAQEIPLTAQNYSKTIANNPANTSTTGQNDLKNEAKALVRVGPVTVVGGRVDFTDRFIKPNYSAHLSELSGTLGAFSSQATSGEVQMADLALRGRAEGTAMLEITGKVNPLAKPVALDIAGRVRDLELAPLSPYAVRYAGYGIERGKLSVDVAYKVQSDGQLTARNNIVLNQLKFGDQVPGAANSLPVKLAVALLADRNGVIDINVPVSGSLNDPQFRLAPIVFKLIVNLVVKAITAPFSLLASAFGGDGDELSMVSFAPGSATLTPEARTGLDKVAKALLARPALKMTVVGAASLELEREAFKRDQLQALMLAEKHRTQAGRAIPATEPLTAQESTALLKAVYKRADFPKPRNLIGMAKDLPEPEMQALLLANLSATESAMQALAVQRGVVVRDYLAGLKLPLERLFLGVAKAVPPEAKWQPRAELSLAPE